MTKRTVDIGEVIYLPDSMGLKCLRTLEITKGTKYVVNDLCYFTPINGVFIVDDIELFITEFNKL